MSPRQRCRSEPQIPALGDPEEDSARLGVGDIVLLNGERLGVFLQDDDASFHASLLDCDGGFKCGAMLCQGHAGVKKRGGLRWQGQKRGVYIEGRRVCQSVFSS